jgi:malonyl-CoA O-methyltransferase
VFDKHLIESRFSKAAQDYDKSAQAQWAIAQHLDGLLSQHIAPLRVLDAGCGTGMLTGLIHERFPAAKIHGIDIAPGMIQLCREKWASNANLTFEVADLENLSLSGDFDLIVSSCCFQWLSSKTAVLKQLRERLAPTGKLGLAVLLEGTLNELSASYETVTDTAMKPMGYWSDAAYKDALENTGFKEIAAEEDCTRCLYNNAWDFLHSLKEIGATMAGHPGYVPLPPPILRQLASVYEAGFSDDNGNVIASYRTLYIVAEALHS